MKALKTIRNVVKPSALEDQTPELYGCKALYYIYCFFIFSLFIMPQYFGVHIGFDITCTRFAIILIIIYFILNPSLFTHFYHAIIRCKIFIPLLLYIFVAFYTMVYRKDFNAFFSVFMETLTLFFLIYGIRYVVGYKRAIKWSISCAYILSVSGLIEYAYGKSFFHQFLSTVPNSVVNGYRSGHYRIMGPCGHSLGYGLLLIFFLAVACYDIERNEIYLFKRPFLFSLVFINIILTGSRSTLGIAVVELAAIVLLSNKKNVIKALFMLFVSFVGIGFLLLLISNTSIGQYILGQIMSVVDQVLGTSFSANFGVDITSLKNSNTYRESLPYIFTLDWLNPFVGRGTRFGGAEINGVYIHSIDNYYVQQYIKYAYPGMIVYILFILQVIISMLACIIIHKSSIVKIAIIGIVAYFINLWWVDSLQTIKFVYFVIAVYYAYLLKIKDSELCHNRCMMKE